jgi:hypothetical protein
MTNDETIKLMNRENPKQWFWRPSSFEFRHSFGIFSIFRFVLMLVLVLVIGVSCVGKRITKANVDEVAEGMSKKQVESILGTPTDIDNKDFVIMKKTTYVYRQDKETVTIVFKDDKVTDKQSTLSD